MDFEPFPTPPAPPPGTPCAPGEGITITEIPTWYKYLNCDANNTPLFENINDVWSILAAVVEIVLFVAGVAAVVFMIIGAIRYITSQGQPEQTKRARQSLIYAVVGLVVSIIGRAVIQLIFNGFSDDGFTS